MDANPSLAVLSSLLRELDERPEKTEHNSVALTHESEYCIEAMRGGHVTFQHLENGNERHMRDLPESKIIELWSQLACGDIASIEEEPWIRGYV